jgi:hypothetical protein
MPSSIRKVFKTIFLETWTSLLFAIYRLRLRFETSRDGTANEDRSSQ